MPELLLPSSVHTTSGEGASIDLGSWRHRVMPVDVVVVSIAGSGATLVAALETSVDGITWEALGDPTDPITMTGTTNLLTEKCERFARIVWTITGTNPVIRFYVTGYAISSYCSPAKFKSLGVQEDALCDYSAEKIANALKAGTGKATTILGGRYTMPLLSWDDDVEEAVAKIAAYTVMSVRGFNPGAGQNNVYRERYLDGLKDLEWIADHGSDTVVGSPEAENTSNSDASAAVESDTRRWRP